MNAPAVSRNYVAEVQPHTHTHTHTHTTHAHISANARTHQQVIASSMSSVRERPRCTQPHPPTPTLAHTHTHTHTHTDTDTTHTHAHARSPACNGVLDSLRERVSQMQRPRHVGRRDDHHEGAARVGRMRGGALKHTGRRASGLGHRDGARGLRCPAPHTRENEFFATPPPLHFITIPVVFPCRLFCLFHC